MIEIEIIRKGDRIISLTSKGHAGYAEEGYDIICAAVSVLSVNLVNSIEEFTEDGMDVTSGDGLIELRLDGELSQEGQLLMRAYILGIQSVQKTYGNEYIELVFKEV